MLELLSCLWTPRPSGCYLQECSGSVKLEIESIGRTKTILFSTLHKVYVIFGWMIKLSIHSLVLLIFLGFFLLQPALAFDIKIPRAMRDDKASAFCANLKTPKLKNGEDLILYSDSSKKVFPLVIIKNGTILPASNYHANTVEKLTLVKNQHVVHYKLKTTVERKGPDRCIWFIEISDQNIKPFELIGTSVGLKLNFQPSENHKSIFKKHSKCVAHGDNPPDKPQCRWPELIATSDLDADGLIEFWMTEIYIWNTGMKVSEYDKKEGLRPISSQCPNCD